MPRHPGRIRFYPPRAGCPEKIEPDPYELFTQLLTYLGNRLPTRCFKVSSPMAIHFRSRRETRNWSRAQFLPPCAASDVPRTTHAISTWILFDRVSVVSPRVSRTGVNRLGRRMAAYSSCSALKGYNMFRCASVRPARAPVELYGAANRQRESGPKAATPNQ